MPPINTIVVQTILLSPERLGEEIPVQTKRLLTGSLEPLNAALAENDCLRGAVSNVDFMPGNVCCSACHLGCPLKT